MAVLNIPVTKAGSKIEVDTDKLPEDAFRAVVEAGLKTLLNMSMSKILTKGLEGDDLAKAQSAALEKAQANLDNLLAGKVKRGRTAAKDASGNKVSGPVMTEARRLAKEVVKNEIRAAGMKISHIEASVITKAANELISADPSFIAQAQANLEARSTVKSAVDIKSLVHESPKLVAKAEKAKAEKKDQLSAKQAGKVAPRKPREAGAHVN
jgi:hypothetical protein